MKQALLGIMQGGMFDLRELSAKQITEIDLPGICNQDCPSVNQRISCSMYDDCVDLLPEDAKIPYGG